MKAHNKLPPELHIINGTKQRVETQTLPESIKERIPEAEWVSNPDNWSKTKFIEETSEFLFQVYGIGSAQDRHTLAMLADQIDTYVLCNKALAVEPLVIEYNGGKTFGPNPNFAIRKECLKSIIALMNELGLTPKGRLAKIKTLDNSTSQKLMRGPKG